MSIAITTDRTIAVLLEAVLGSFRTVGRLGPVYEVLHVVDGNSTRDPVVRIRVLEIGEELEYSLAHVIEDLRAA